MKKRYITFFDRERGIVSDLPWGEDNLVVVLATDTKRLERARVEFNERLARMLRTEKRSPEDQANTLREISSLVAGMRPTSIPHRLLAPEPDVEAKANRSSSLRFAHLLDAKLLSRKNSLKSIG
ncbi:hypothetical protein ASG42_10910 [Rhizobium sp. Leaf391]|uniref:hypothetical protein n=1 Tax=Rhizobium sp. Leaf391 TaxID=1736360 RepID=UPI000715127B|nr:hypothetical protein [Rhizobium sp. Leaf391]KQS90999.1 hypothetical protein ASG42_10910 [Rhizobium sp. Leaf391]